MTDALQTAVAQSRREALSHAKGEIEKLVRGGEQLAVSKKFEHLIGPVVT